MVDSIYPIVPGPSPISSGLPVEPSERVSRERDRPSRERRERTRRESTAASELPPALEGDDGAGGSPRDGTSEEDGGEHQHVDVRA
jgi:hypothetical protein